MKQSFLFNEKDKNTTTSLKCVIYLIFIVKSEKKRPFLCEKADKEPLKYPLLAENGYNTDGRFDDTVCVCNLHNTMIKKVKKIAIGWEFVKNTQIL